MATYSDILQLSLPAQGESSVHGFANWGDLANSNFSFLEDALGEVSNITLAGANVTLTDAQERSLVLNLTGTLSANVEVRTNDRKGFWHVVNGTSGSYTVTVKPTSGSGVTVPQGDKALLWSDGTNILSIARAPMEKGGGSMLAAMGFFAGSASLPGLHPTGDTNTGMWSPTADTIAFSTNGTERARLDSSGNLGLGRTASYQFDVYRSGTTNTTIAAANDTIVAALYASGTDGAAVGSLSNHPVLFVANNSEVGRITASGQFSLNGDVDTYLYNPDLDEWGIQAGGTLVFEATATTVNVPVALTRAGNTVWDAGNSARSLATNGYQEFQDGTIIQWGKYTGGANDPSISFPLEFPNACTAVECTPASAPSSTAMFSVSTASETTTGFNAYQRFASNGGTVGQTNIAFHWFAVGY